MHDRSTGLRHRAAVGLAEETDAITVVVSEETGSISICVEGKIERNLTEKQFRENLAKIFVTGNAPHENAPAEKLDRQAAVTPAGGRDLVSD